MFWSTVILTVSWGLLIIAQLLRHEALGYAPVKKTEQPNFYRFLIGMYTVLFILLVGLSVKLGVAYFSG